MQELLQQAVHPGRRDDGSAKGKDDERTESQRQGSPCGAETQMRAEKAVNTQRETGLRGSESGAEDGWTGSSDQAGGADEGLGKQKGAGRIATNSVIIGSPVRGSLPLLLQLV